MAEHLSYIQSKSHSYVYEDEDKRISRADENYAREVWVHAFTPYYYIRAIIQCYLVLIFIIVLYHL